MRYCNAFVFLPDRGFVRGGFDVEDGRFAAVFTDERDGEVDLCGACVIPGLVDIHTHGAMGADFSDGDAEGLRRMAAHLAGRGVTSFAARASWASIWRDPFSPKRKRARRTART